MEFVHGEKGVYKSTTPRTIFFTQLINGLAALITIWTS